MNCLTACQTLPWPARLQNLSPNKHVWDMMRRRLHLKVNADDLVRQLEQIWQKIPQKNIRNFYSSIPRRVVVYIQARSRSIFYWARYFVIIQFWIKSFNCSEILIIFYSVHYLPIHQFLSPSDKSFLVRWFFSYTVYFMQWLVINFWNKRRTMQHINLVC